MPQVKTFLRTGIALHSGTRLDLLFILLSRRSSRFLFKHEISVHELWFFSPYSLHSSLTLHTFQGIYFFLHGFVSFRCLSLSSTCFTMGSLSRILSNVLIVNHCSTFLYRCGYLPSVSVVSWTSLFEITHVGKFDGQCTEILFCSVLPCG